MRISDSTIHLPVNEYRKVNELQGIKFTDKHDLPVSAPGQGGVDTAVVSFQYGSDSTQQAEVEIDSVDKKVAFTYLSQDDSQCRLARTVYKYELGSGWRVIETNDPKLAAIIDKYHNGAQGGTMEVKDSRISFRGDDQGLLTVVVEDKPPTDQSSSIRNKNTTTVVAKPAKYPGEEGVIETSGVHHENNDSGNAQKSSKKYTPMGPVRPEWSENGHKFSFLDWAC